MYELVVHRFTYLHVQKGVQPFFPYILSILVNTSCEDKAKEKECL